MLGPALLALFSTAVLTPVATRSLRRRGLFDVPNDRSSHVEPVPRGGGMAVTAGALIGILAFSWAPENERLALALAALLFGAVGLAEDLVGVPALRRLVLQLAVAVLVVPLFLAQVDEARVPSWLVAAGVVLGLMSYVNAYNFMDGIDGISVAQALVAGAAFALVGEARSVETLAVGGAIVAGAALGFAPYNFPRGRVFLGDGGSYFVGALLAGLAVVGIAHGVPPEAVVAPLALYLADTGSTLLRRLRQGAVWYEPHRDHVYQRLVRQGWTHARTTALVGILAAVCSGLGAVSLDRSTGLRLAALAGMAVLLAGYLALPAYLSLRRRSVRSRGNPASSHQAADPAVSG